MGNYFNESSTISYNKIFKEKPHYLRALYVMALNHISQILFYNFCFIKSFQSIEAACYMGVLKSPKLLIAGDHKQLPPTIISNDAANQGLTLSLMERVIGMYGFNYFLFVLTSGVC